MIECRTETGIYRSMDIDTVELCLSDISTENQSVMWFDSLLEAVQAAQDYHENIGPAS
jgi:hypothetical protein